MKLPVRTTTLQRSDLPVTLRGFRMDTGEKVWEEVIEDGPVALRVPPLSKENDDAKIRIEVEYGDGTIESEVP